jgi:diacylglycerol kinase (ATP)
MRLLFVINPVSGAGQTDWHLIIGQWLKEQAQHTGDFYIMQEGTDNAAQLKKQFDRLLPDRLVVAGGDGTVKMAAEILIDKQVPLGLSRPVLPTAWRRNWVFLLMSIRRWR